MSIVPASKKVPAGLLAIFLGFVGVHKFYLGLNRAGAVTVALYILGIATTWLFGLGALILFGLHTLGFIEGIVYLVKSDSNFYRDYMVRRQEWL